MTLYVPLLPGLATPQASGAVYGLLMCGDSVLAAERAKGQPALHPQASAARKHARMGWCFGVQLRSILAAACEASTLVVLSSAHLNSCVTLAGAVTVAVEWE